MTSAHDHHLTAGSAAIGGGVDAGVTSDLDDRVRPIGRLDLGADEWGMEVFVPVVLRSYRP